MRKLLTALCTTFISINSYAENVLEHFSQVIESFQKNQGSWITSNCQHLLIENTHYYGIRVDQQMQKHNDLSQDLLATRQLYQEIKGKVLQQMGLSKDAEVIQVVGDSAPFSQEGTVRAKEFLRAYLPMQAVVLFGYTGFKASDGTRCTNAAVSDIMAERSQLDRTIGNLVGFHTPTALKKWGFTGPELAHYVVVYGNDETCREKGTVFGDDVTTSDFFADRLLLLDGGPQSFRQVCNALLLDQKIDVLSGLRTPTRDSNDLSISYFAAAKFLQDISAFTEGKDALSKADLKEWYQNYFGPGKCSVADPQNPDFDTKQRLIDDAWELFLNERLDRKIPILVRFHQ